MTKLTITQKQDLRQASITLLQAHEQQAYSSKEILNMLDSNVSAIMLTSILTDYISCNTNTAEIVRISNGNKPYTYQYVSINQRIEVTTIEKNKNLLLFYNNDKTKCLQYDFNTLEFNDLYKIVTTQNENIDRLLNLLRRYNLCEWAFSYMDLIDDYSELTRIREDCPKGYINWLKSNNLKITEETLNIFKASKVLPNYNYMQLKNILDFPYHNDLIAHADVLKSVLKMLNISFKAYDIDAVVRAKERMRTFIQYMRQLNYDTSILDTNRDLLYNLNNLENLIKREQNKILENQLKRLNFINGLTYDDYIVVVPQTIEDLQTEGRQQNNCVGHWYNDSIKEGRNFIYFLRRQNDPTKSVVTCRYNLSYNATIEHRTKNNNDTTQTQDNIINEIDKVIRANFK